MMYDAETGHVDGVVQASYKDTAYKVSIDMDASFGVAYSSCECAMGKYSCHHVAALLLYGYKCVSKTDVKCAWLRHPKSRQRAVTVTMSELYPTHKADYRALNRAVTNEDRSYLHDELCKLRRFTALQWIISPEPPKVTYPAPVVEDLLLSELYLSSECKQVWLRTALHMSSQNIEELAQLTKGQRNNPLWSIMRKHRLTASNFGIVLAACNRKRFAILLVAQMVYSITPSLYKRLLSSYNLESVHSVTWGINHEETALEQYRSLGGIVYDTGIWLHESGVLGASPDGIVLQPAIHGSLYYQSDSANCCKPDLIEVKCLYTSRNTTIYQAAQSQKNFPLIKHNDGWILNPSHDYYHQVQGQLHITGFNCCDFVMWTTVDMAIIRIVKDSVCSQNISRLIDFYYNVFIPTVTQ